MAPFMMYHTHSFAAHSLAGPVLMIGLWVIQLLIAFLIYRDAKEQKMFAPVWTVLAILPLFGYLIDVLYLIIREVRPSRKVENPPASL
ncbi:hypothetical protein [Methanoregula sp.]|uniref:hypothetical protein n=1 Tax=Methanoregula sp. TaxID=2052170 RepID=UPI003BAEDD44